MSIKHFAAAALVGALLAGCNMPAPGQPSTGASTAPTTGGTIDAGTVASIWKVGQKYIYDMKATAAGTSTNGTMTWEVLKVEGTMVTLKTSSEIGGVKGPETTSTFDAANKEGAGKVGAQSDVTTTLTSTTKESVTVAAGTYANATKYVYEMSGKAKGTLTTWVDDSVGLLKSVSTITPETPVLPAGVPMPAGLDLSSSTTMELKGVVK